MLALISTRLYELSRIYDGFLFLSLYISPYSLLLQLNCTEDARYKNKYRIQWNE